MKIPQTKLMTILTILCFGSLVLALSLEQLYFHSQNNITITIYLFSYLCGGYFATSRALSDLKQKNINIEFLMIFAAIGSAVINQYFEGAILLFLFSLSGTLEKLVLGKTRSAIEKLLNLSPQYAVVIRGEREEKIPVAQLRKGDVVSILPGEKIPGDGVIIKGDTTIDQALLTGESQLVEKGVGELVYAATLNQDGAIQVQITKESSETFYSRIIKLIEEAQSEKAASENFTNWFGKKYTLLILFVSTIAFFIYNFIFQYSSWLSFYKAMTLLVVGSPCAVVISIPAAILSAITAAARKGILFKGGVHLETLAALKAIAFDKTGTLTLGQPKVVEIVSFGGHSESELLSLAASAEILSEHALGRAVVKEAQKRKLELKKVSATRAIIGKGLEAESDGGLIVLGKKNLFKERGIALRAEIEAKYDLLSEQGNTVILIALESEIYGLIALADVLRTDSKETLESLRKLGIEKMLLITGDNTKVAKQVANDLKIDFFADLMPEDKLNIIKKLRTEYQTVAMVGDGINDAPALTSANLGISLGGAGTDVALESADVILMGAELKKLPQAIELARETKKIIRQNLSLAFAVMLSLFILALTADLKLPFAVAGHEGSTVVVILNGIRLLSFFSRKKATI